MLYVVIWHPKGKRPETYSQWEKEDAQSLIDFYDFAEDETTVFDTVFRPLNILSNRQAVR